MGKAGQYKRREKMENKIAVSRSGKAIKDHIIIYLPKLYTRHIHLLKSRTLIKTAT